MLTAWLMGLFVMRYDSFFLGSFCFIWITMSVWVHPLLS